MTSFTVVPIPAEISAAAREQGADPVYGHPAHEEPATGYGPCRACLRPFEPGEPRLLLTLDAFHGTGTTPRPGPVFVHAEPCTPYAADRFPPELAFLPLVLEAHDADGALVRAERASGEEADDAIASLLADDDVAFVQVRNAEAGCHITRAVAPV
jgi:Protein of unknown function (DUF1203)